MLRSENVSLTDVIWGQYGNSRIFIFKVDDSTAQFSQSRVFLNGNFYSKIEIEDIDQLLANKNHLEFVADVFGNETETETIEVLVAQVYLQLGIETDYATVKEIFKLLKKFSSSKTSLKDRLVGGFLGAVKSDIKFNCPEAIEFVSEKNRDLNREIIGSVANTYENLLDIYNKNNTTKSEALL